MRFIEIPVFLDEDEKFTAENLLTSILVEVRYRDYAPGEDEQHPKEKKRNMALKENNSEKRSQYLKEAQPWVKYKQFNFDKKNTTQKILKLRVAREDRPYGQYRITYTFNRKYFETNYKNKAMTPWMTLQEKEQLLVSEPARLDIPFRFEFNSDDVKKIEIQAKYPTTLDEEEEWHKYEWHKKGGKWENGEMMRSSQVTFTTRGKKSLAATALKSVLDDDSGEYTLEIPVIAAQLNQKLEVSGDVTIIDSNNKRTKKEFNFTQDDDGFFDEVYISTDDL